MLVKQQRRRLPLFGAVVAALALCLPPSAHAASASAAVKPAVREWGYISLKDGVRLSYVSYRPDDGRTYPVLINFSPYAESTTEAAGAQSYLDHGYIYVAVDIRGTGCSTGTLSLFDPLLADDGVQAVEFIGARPWSNGSVGMVGVSYRGHSQVFTASKHPKYLRSDRSRRSCGT